MYVTGVVPVPVWLSWTTVGGQLGSTGDSCSSVGVVSVTLNGPGDDAAGEDGRVAQHHIRASAFGFR